MRDLSHDRAIHHQAVGSQQRQLHEASPQLSTTANDEAEGRSIMVHEITMLMSAMAHRLQVSRQAPVIRTSQKQGTARRWTQYRSRECDSALYVMVSAIS